MTNEKAIRKIKSLCHGCVEFPHCVNTDPDCFKALEMAIKALEQDSCDCISREYILSKAHCCCDELADDELCCVDVDDIKEAPSIQPKPKTDVLDKIRAEINSPNRGTCDYFIVDRIEEIIDKYTAESGDNK